MASARHKDRQTGAKYGRVFKGFGGEPSSAAGFMPSGHVSQFNGGQNNCEAQ